MHQIRTEAEWEMVLLESREGPVVVYKHSTACTGCMPSFREMEEAVTYRDIIRPVYYVVVQESRELSDLIAKDLSLEHHTPQAIVVLNERACYAVGGDDSDISAADIAAKIELIWAAHKELFGSDS